MKKTNRIGETQHNFYGNKMTIIEYIDCNNITVQFEDGYIMNNIIYGNFKKGCTKSPYDKSVYNVGYLGEGVYQCRADGKITKQYLVWRTMLLRCYDQKFHNKESTYINCLVCEEWHNFQNFAKWFDENYYEIKNEKMQLDKDILHKGNKVYSPDTCVFVPEKINCLFTKTNKKRGKYPIGVCYHKGTKSYIALCNNGKGNQKHLGCFDSPFEAFKTYKLHKEKIIKQVADEYKDKIPQKLYDAMYSYSVEITD